MTHRMYIDIETYSDVDIGKAGLYKYALSPAFDVLLIAWAVDDGPVEVVDLTAGNPSTASRSPSPFRGGKPSAPFREMPDGLEAFLRRFYDEDTVRFAYNAAFEHFCLNVWLRRRGLPTLQLGDWRCVMAHAAYCGYPMGLAATGAAMGLPEDKQKDSIGKALIRKFCVPHAPDITSPTPYRVQPSDDPEKWRLFIEYCRQDVEAEREIERRLSRWRFPGREQMLWELTTEANAFGVGMDAALVGSAIAMSAAQTELYMNEARAITGLSNPNSAPQLQGWLRGRGIETDDLTKATVAELLAGENLPEDVRRALELRQLMAKTSTKKYDAIAEAMCDDGRVRGLMMYYGASRSGRWAGRIVQPQNLPQNHLKNLDRARELAKAGDAELLALSYGSIPDALSQLIRTAFIPSKGKRYAIADYSAIEARVVAWLAGESWVLEAFERGEDIYCATASQMFGVPVEKHGQNAHLRQRGKVAVLALGYGGGESALVAMGALKMGIPEEDLEEIKKKWRSANPAICRFWTVCEDAAVNAITSGTAQTVQIKVRDPERARRNEEIMNAEPGSFSDYFKVGAKLVFRLETDADSGQRFLTVQLPTGRKLFYAQPELRPAKKAPAKKAPGKLSLHYMSQNQNTRKWGWTDTWGGKLVENITQAVARDCLAETLIRLHGRGLDPVFHVHDEVICEVDDDGWLDEILDVMAEPIDWAPGLPLKGAGFCADYYQKD